VAVLHVHAKDVVSRERTVDAHELVVAKGVDGPIGELKQQVAPFLWILSYELLVEPQEQVSTITTTSVSQDIDADQQGNH
jgi:hypothetical protein